MKQLVLSSPYNPLIEFRKLCGRGVSDGHDKDGTSQHAAARDELGRAARIITATEALNFKCDWHTLVPIIPSLVASSEELHLFVSKRGDLRVRYLPFFLFSFFFFFFFCHFLA
jgi:hypothetical protein